MPDADRTHPSAPIGWGDAFASLPMEAAPADGWQRLQRALDAPSRRDTRVLRRRWPLWAAAATVCAVALIPILMRDTPQSDVAPMVATNVPKQRAAATSAPAVAAVDQDAAPSPVGDDVADDAIAKSPASTPRKRRPSPTTPPHEAAPRRLVASADAAPASTDADTGAAAELSALQAQSAQLEALVALARDDRVASASSAALTVELDERIGRIDASLSQPGLDDTDRTSLWHERVATMRELAGVETTRVWLTASGERYDGALVSVD